MTDSDLKKAMIESGFGSTVGVHSVTGKCFKITEEEARKVRIHNAYIYFVDAFDDIDISKLSDKDLKQFRDICDNGLIEADRELYKRGL